MRSREIRQTFLEYFQRRDHTIVSSSSLIPAHDPTLLFTNAGMVQFKDVFLGVTPLMMPDGTESTRAASAQRCVRAGGKHNDLDNVGYTARHHTFFEMLGNFSFGDYFKREAIQYAWDFLTGVVKLPPEKLWVTVFRDDDEAADIWLEDIKVDPKRFSRCGEKDNFWAMGDTGPCGPCSEIFYDHGPEVAGGPPGSLEQEGDRYIEIWNLVFMQYERSAAGELTALPKPSVDTGMGLERLAAVLQGVHSNYDIDLFRELLRAASQITHAPIENNQSLRVIADHIRSCSFLITDGVMPSNEGRGYVLRRIIRRAIRHGHHLGMREPFFYKLVPALVDEMGDAYPELIKAHTSVENILRQEEEQFARTLDQGIKLLTDAMEKTTGNSLAGETVFRLYDTYGFPADLTADIAREHGLQIDMTAFDFLMARQREQSQQASQFAVLSHEGLDIQGETEFHGYTTLEKMARVTHLWHEKNAATELIVGQRGIVVLDQSPFYAESGGQVGDRGVIKTADAEFHVQDTQKQGHVFLHHGVLLKGSLHVNDDVEACVDAAHREAVMLNHTATHLLHAALRYELGEHVLQKGSLVAADRLRFDFTHYEALTQSQIDAIEALVNAKIRADLAANIQVMTPKEAQKTGALALFGEKYGATVRVLSIGDFSKELCGGTHVDHTGQIGYFKIINETSIAAGVRRLEAITGDAAVQWVQQLEQQQNAIAHALKTKPTELMHKVTQLQADNRQLAKQIEQLKMRLASGAGADLATHAQDVEGICVLATQIADADPKTLRETVDQLKDKLGPQAAIVLATVTNARVHVIAGVTKKATERVHAAELVNFVAEQVGGKGGGRADMAQAGGGDPAQLSQALAAVPEWVRAKVKT